MANTGDAVVSGELKAWHDVTLDFTGPARAEDAATFRDHTLDVTLTNQATGETLVVPGYFAADGDAANTSATRPSDPRTKPCSVLSRTYHA